MEDTNRYATPNAEEVAIAHRPSRRWAIGCSAIPIGVSLVLGAIGWTLGTEEIDSTGAPWINVALLFHFPVILMLRIFCPSLPTVAGEEGGFEFGLLLVCVVPSAMIYWYIGRVFDEASEPLNQGGLLQQSAPF